jgi:S-methylmethionine-dependent homocysteine/selenocysteine methylase
MRHRDHLPQLDGGVFLTDAGLETELVFHDGIDLPLFAAFDVLKDEAGTERLRRYYREFAGLARDLGVGFVLESPTWRASPRWAEEIGYSEEQLDELNRKAIAVMEEVREEYETPRTPIVISGCIGPHDDGYSPSTMLSADEAQRYHATQIRTFADTAADMVTAITMTYPDEATGVVRAAREAGMPVAISFTLETDGRLPGGQELGDAIDEVDGATDGAPVYYMINCAHPTHFADAIEAEAPWTRRIRGLRANASERSHAELDEATELDEGDPVDLSARYVELKDKLPQLTVLGGCCGTDFRHVERIADAWLSEPGSTAAQRAS